MKPHKGNCNIFTYLSSTWLSVILITWKSSNTYGLKEKRSEHYVNNKEFLAALEVYIAQVNRAKLNDKEPPQIPRYIGECFLKIANPYHINQTLLTICLRMT